jgi:hypothetical protein
MKKFLLSILFLSILTTSKSQVNLKYSENITPTYQEVIDNYKLLDRKHAKAKLITYGPTDSGKPLHLFVISSDKDFSPKSLHKKNKRILLINNGIHPGEPDGIDASLQLADDILNNRNDLSGLLNNTVICIVPVLNIGGALNRSPYNRTNQNGPVELGFRANAKNQDLNRDFIKLDAENTKSFIQILREWNPDIFIDTHTSNGADYQYVMTIIPTQHNKLHPVVGNFLNVKMVPRLYSALAKTPYEMTPYVQTMGGNIEKGIIGFMDSPRYTSGYAALFNTLGFITETHMFKPYADRVMATYEFIAEVIRFTNVHSNEIGEIRKKAIEETINIKEHVIQWKLDTTKKDSFSFKGYESGYKTSKITGNLRLYYDRDKPYERKIPFYNYYQPVVVVQKPDFYLIPQAWKEVIERLHLNGVQMKQFLKDTTLLVQTYYIEDYTTSQRPNNGRYYHSNVKIRTKSQKIDFYTGDFVIETNQVTNNLLVQTLEPHAVDSYFSWNFFDAILSRKEYFSGYIFEDYAEEFLYKNPEVRKELDERKRNDLAFAENANAQLNFIYEKTPYFEQSYLRLPVYRLNKMQKLPVN